MADETQGKGSAVPEDSPAERSDDGSISRRALLKQAGWVVPALVVLPMVPQKGFAHEFASCGPRRPETDSCSGKASGGSGASGPSGGSWSSGPSWKSDGSGPSDPSTTPKGRPVPAPGNGQGKVRGGGPFWQWLRDLLSFR